MTSLEQAIDLVGRLTRGEKARLVRDIVSQLDESFPGIDTQLVRAAGSPKRHTPLRWRFSRPRRGPSLAIGWWRTAPSRE